MERILMMILRPLISKGINFGIKSASNLGKKNQDETPEERQLEGQSKRASSGLRQTSRLARRFTKF